MPTTGEISLYFHIPFCRKKCPYCHFYVVAQAGHPHKMFLKALAQEWQLYQPLTRGKKIVSVYFGGGTPFLLGADAIEEILSWIDIDPHKEITLEANPEDLFLETIQPFARIGINRLSIGIQSLDDATLHMLGRSHTAQKGKEAVWAAARAGINNISIDLMYDIPSQRIAPWKTTLESALALPIQHLSLYNLTFEPRTLFFTKKKSLTPLLPSPEESRSMLDLAVDMIQRKLPRYEISAFATPEFTSQHNIGYWEGRPFLGFGPSAFSYWEGKRYRNVCHLSHYIEALENQRPPIDFEETLPPAHQLHERLAIHLRLLQGVSMTDYPVPTSLYQNLQEKGWIAIEGNTARLTATGLLFYDSVAQEIIL